LAPNKVEGTERLQQENSPAIRELARNMLVSSKNCVIM
jgi:hypothetical protein